MKQINEQHIAEPGLVVLDTARREPDTIHAVMSALEEPRATSGIGGAP
ncbi:hypothetical protein KPP03845_100173 [Streptomyces xanthophaeus]|nr:DUF6207 family protein [Streptomyces xanthophaeus]WCD83854.1 hypothetical protein KPP03845_100173 [Streptomyces xanthophaeus]